MPDGPRRGQARVHVWISGRVQGVGFRYATVSQAQRYDLGGWVRNLSDGRVEAVFEGPAAEVARVVAWCRTGPPGAWVADVQTSAEQPRDETTFRTRQTDFRGESP